MSNDSPKNTLISKIEFVNPVTGSDMINKSLSSGKSEILELESIKREKNYILVIEKANKFLSENKYEKDCEIRLLILKAEALACVGKIEESKMLFMKMLKDDLISPRVYSGLGSLEASSSNWNKAIEYFEKSLLDHPSIDVPLAGLGMCSHSLGNLEDSWNYYSESLRRNPINIHSILGLLDLSYNMKRLSEVEPFLRSYLDHKPVDLNIIYSLAGCLYGQGKTLDAIYELKNILAYEPEHLHARELLDKIEGDKDNFQEISVN
jgi:tetratricopeptide (TPR) repeat protein